MGYCISLVSGTFQMKKEDFAKALKAVQRLVGHETIHDSSGHHFSWVSQDFAKLNSFVETTNVVEEVLPSSTPSTEVEV